MYQYNRKKEIIKNTIYIIFILLLAIIPTYYIYNKFQNYRDISVNSTSLDVTYHETTGDKITLTKITPVTDSVGLSSKAYQITISNNLTEKINYKVKLFDDLETIKEDLCENNLVSKDVIKVSIKTSKTGNKIYNLSELENDVLLEDTLEALEKVNVSIRVWVRQDSGIPSGTKMHYHGKIQVEEVNK
jgi:hypothetical protein